MHELPLAGTGGRSYSICITRQLSCREICRQLFAGIVTAFLQSDLISHRRNIMSLGNLLHYFRDANQEDVEQEREEQTFHTGQQAAAAKTPRDPAARAYLFRTAALMIVGISAAAALLFVILRGDAAQRSLAAESDRKLEEKLTVIEKSIRTLRSGSVQSGESHSQDAEQYKKVTAAVTSMRQNLDSFRQGSSNTNEELSQSLDSVIQGLDTLQKEMKEAGKKSAAEADKAAKEEENRRKALDQRTLETQKKLDQTAEGIRKQIQLLLAEAGDSQSSETEELKKALSETDEELGSLLKGQRGELGAGIQKTQEAIAQAQKNITETGQRMEKLAEDSAQKAVARQAELSQGQQTISQQQLNSMEKQETIMDRQQEMAQLQAAIFDSQDAFGRTQEQLQTTAAQILDLSGALSDRQNEFAQSQQRIEENQNALMKQVEELRSEVELLLNKETGEKEQNPLEEEVLQKQEETGGQQKPETDASTQVPSSGEASGNQ